MPSAGRARAVSSVCRVKSAAKLNVSGRGSQHRLVKRHTLNRQKKHSFIDKEKCRKHLQLTSLSLSLFLTPSLLSLYVFHFSLSLSPFHSISLCLPFSLFLISLSFSPSLLLSHPSSVSFSLCFLFIPMKRQTLGAVSPLPGRGSR